MKQIKLLDCTLRDGGYVNDWNFGHDNIVNIFERLISAGVDILEIGFLDERRPYDRNRSIMPDTKSADQIYGRLDKGHTMIVGMIVRPSRPSVRLTALLVPTMTKYVNAINPQTPSG